MVSFKEALQEAAVAVSAQTPETFSKSFAQAELVNSGIESVSRFDQDIARLKKEAGILIEGTGGTDGGKKMADLFNSWRDDPVSTPAIIAFAAEHFGISPDDKNLRAALMAGIAAEVQNDNPYHSNHHFREVTATMVRLCATHNDLATQNKNVVFLETDNIAKCLLAAAGHDLMHDGKTNSLSGPESHEQYRLENKAIDAIEPFMKIAGMNGRDREDVRVMIRITDISAKPGTASPHKHLKETVQFAQTHMIMPPELLQPPTETILTTPPDVAAGKLQSSFISLPPDAGKSPVPEQFILPKELADLVRSPQLLTMATLMSDADLGPSTATNFDYSRRMTTLLSKENPALADSNKTLDGFLTFVVGGELTSQAGRTASGATLQSIMQNAKQPDPDGAEKNQPQAPQKTAKAPVAK
jgi:hypothetical protein